MWGPFDGIVGHFDDDAIESLIGDEEIAPCTQYKDAIVFGLGIGKCIGELFVIMGVDEFFGTPADMHRRMFR